jgi:SAM-dependent methyltransferase
MTWTELDWPTLDRLRDKFLQGSIHAPYWETSDDLANYDFTFGERIGWKWDQVLRELRLRGWRPSRHRHVFDWGCGSGIASRRVISFFGPENFDSLTVWDHSPLACDYAAETAQQAFPTLRVAQATPGLLASNEPIGLLLVSHVLNELTPEALASLRSLIDRADAVLWVEPGTHEVSRRLGTFRDELRATFRILAPCTHELGCPMFAPGNERHWCHFFAPPPAEIFADSNWVKFGQRAGIDLRSLPYAFIALERSPDLPPPPPDLSRVIGRVEHFKPYARLLNCDATGLTELELPKRADPALFKQLERTKAPLVYRWQRDGDKLLGGEPLASAPES